VGEADSERRLGLGGVAQLLGVPRLTVWWWVRTGQLRRMNLIDGVPWWSPEQVFEWALDSDKRLSGRVPLTAWSDANPGRPAAYLGAMDLDGAVATRWATTDGTLALVWPLVATSRRHRAGWARQVAPDGQGAVIVVTRLFSRGPDLDAILPGKTHDETYSPLWSEAARVLGSPVPFWLAALRLRELIHAWKPGAAPVTALAGSELDTSALLQLAATYEHGHPHAQVLVHLAQQANQMAYNGAANDLEILGRSGFDPQQMLVAALPLRGPQVDPDDLQQVQRRAAWADVLARSDTLAAQAVRIADAINGGDDFPSGNQQDIDPARSVWAREWSGRLEPTARTAAHELLDDDTDGEALSDPETDVPAVRGTDGTLSAAMPQRIPARAPLAELILDRDAMIWVRTADGTLYPAPRDSYYGINWGYTGSGPGALALLIAALLDDITAKAPADINGAPAGLEKLASTKLPAGTVLSRRDLEAARNGRWLPVFTEDTDDEPDEDDQ
jgi:hypothetical protein